MYADEYSCTDFSSSNLNSRILQTSFYEGQATDIDFATGNRHSTTFGTGNITWPGHSETPADTSWWTDANEMPGSEKGALASGFETTYDRVRVLSALAVIHFPLYNYFPGRDEERHLGSFIGMDADGSVRNNGSEPFWLDLL